MSPPCTCLELLPTTDNKGGFLGKLSKDTLWQAHSEQAQQRRAKLGGNRYMTSQNRMYGLVTKIIRHSTAYLQDEANLTLCTLGERGPIVQRCAGQLHGPTLAQTAKCRL